MACQKVVCQDTCLRESIHSLLYFSVDMSIRRQRKKVVLVNDFLQDELDWDAHVLKRIHGGAEVKVLDIQAHVFCILGGDGAVPHTF